MSVSGEAFLLKEKKRIEIFTSTGQLAKARKATDRLCKKFSHNPEAWFLAGAVCAQQKDFKQAVVCCKKIVQLAPHVPIGYLNLGIALHGMGKQKESINALQKAIELQPNMVEAYRELGVVYFSMGDFNAAIQSTKELVKLQPKDLNSWITLGNIYEKNNDLENAKESYQSAFNLNANSVAAGVNLGNVFKALKQYDEAESCYKKLLKTQPNNVDVLYSLGFMYQSLYRYADAETLYRQALEINALHIATQNNLGVVLMAQNKADESAELFKNIVRSQPENTEARRNLANIYREQNKLDDAEKELNTVLVANKNNIPAQQDRALVWLQKGLFEKGWNEYESRLIQTDEFIKKWPFTVWNGESDLEKTLLVYPEQGVGDEVMFSSCILDLVGKVKKVVLACDVRLETLFQRSFPDVIVIGRTEQNGDEWLKKLPHIDFQISIASLPKFFRNQLADFKNKNSGLQVDANALEKWQARYNELGEGCKVGISWRGGHVTNTKFKRSLVLEQWREIFNVENTHFINLQYGQCAEELSTVKKQMGVVIHDWQDSDPLTNLDDFAAQIKALDLVISIDNSTVHFAGALQVPTWILQPFSSDWRWLSESTDSYWYESVKQFRQSVPGEWADVTNRVSTMLRNEIINTD